MTYLDDAILLDLLTHGDQRLDDLDALARYAMAAGSPDLVDTIWALTNAVAQGHTDHTIPLPIADRIKRLHTTRIDRLAALVQEGYAQMIQPGTHPGATIVAITPRGRDAVCSAIPH